MPQDCGLDRALRIWLGVTPSHLGAPEPAPHGEAVFAYGFM